MKILILTALLACGCASSRAQGGRSPESAMSTERRFKVCVFNILTGLMLLPTKGFSSFESPCEENAETKDLELWLQPQF